MEIDPPPSTKLTKPVYNTIDKGKELHRIHLSMFDPVEFNPGKGEKTRFSPFTNSNNEFVSSLYAGSTFRSVVHETIFNKVPANAKPKTIRIQKVRTRTHSWFNTKNSLTLIELRNPELKFWGTDRNHLIASRSKDFSKTIIWAKAIYESFPEAHGLVWKSNQFDTDDSFLFFGDRVSDSEFINIQSRNVSTDDSFLKDVVEEGGRQGIKITI